MLYMLRIMPAAEQTQACVCCWWAAAVRPLARAEGPYLRLLGAVTLPHAKEWGASQCKTACRYLPIGQRRLSSRPPMRSCAWRHAGARDEKEHAGTPYAPAPNTLCKPRWAPSWEGGRAAQLPHQLPHAFNAWGTNDTSDWCLMMYVLQARRASALPVHSCASPPARTPKRVSPAFR